MKLKINITDLVNMVDPAVWGPPVWDALHFIAAGYPVHPTEADARAYGDFVRLFASVLPCAPCRQHFAEHLREVPADAPLASGRVEFFAWSVAFHNAVNAALGKPALSLDDAVARYVEGAGFRRPGWLGNPVVIGGVTTFVLLVVAWWVVGSWPRSRR